MSKLSIQIIAAVSGDHQAIRSLATAVAQGDAAGVHAILSARGIEVDPAELAAAIAQSSQGAGANCTCTCT